MKRQHLPRNTRLRGNTYYGYIRIPHDVKAILGKSVIERSLKTNDPLEAKRRAAAFSAEVWETIAVARKVSREEESDFLIKLRNEFKASQNQIKQLERKGYVHQAEAVEHAAIESIVEDQFPERYNRQPDLEEWAIISGKKKPFKLLVEEFLRHQEPTVKASTYDARVKQYKNLTEAFPIIDDITKPALREWLFDKNWTARTKKTYLRLVIQVLKFHDIPYQKLESIDIRPAKDEEEQASRAFNIKRINPYQKDESVVSFRSSELKTYFDFVDDELLYDASLIALHTGLRPEECATILCQNINLNDSCFSIVGGKTDNATRTQPIHSKIRPIFEKRFREKGLLFEELSHLSSKFRQPITKKFSQAKKSAGLPLHKITFVSFRKTFRTALDYARVDSSICDELMGHAHKNLGLRVYSQADRLEFKREAVEKLDFKI